MKGANLAGRGSFAKAKRLATHLNAVAAEVAFRESRPHQQVWEGDDEAPWSVDLFSHWRGLEPLVAIADALDHSLMEAGFNAEPPPAGLSDFF